MYILTSTTPLDQKLVYAQYKLDDLPSNYEIAKINDVEVNFNEIFELGYDDNGRPCIKYTEKIGLSGDDYGSVQYWYYDANGDGYLHFVFGINTKPGSGNKKIYTSILKSRDKRVYNYMHNRIGTVMDYSTEANKNKYGQEQYFEED